MIEKTGRLMMSLSRSCLISEGDEICCRWGEAARPRRLPEGESVRVEEREGRQWAKSREIGSSAVGKLKISVDLVQPGSGRMLDLAVEMEKSANGHRTGLITMYHRSWRRCRHICCPFDLSWSRRRNRSSTCSDLFRQIALVCRCLSLHTYIHNHRLCQPPVLTNMDSS